MADRSSRPHSQPAPHPDPHRTAHHQGPRAAPLGTGPHRAPARPGALDRAPRAHPLPAGPPGAPGPDHRPCHTPLRTCAPAGTAPAPPTARRSAPDSRARHAPAPAASTARAPPTPRRPPARVPSGVRTRRPGRSACAWVTGLRTRLGRVSVPVPATHCQLSWLLAMSPSTSRSRKCRAPTRQSTYSVLVRKLAVSSRPRLCIQPSWRSWRMRRVDDRVAGAALLPRLGLLLGADRQRSCRAR